MSKRLDVLIAVKALITAALPFATVLGLDADDAKPEAIPAGGLVIIRAGDPGQPTVDLSPLAYNYEHVIPLEFAAYQSSSLTSEQVLDAMMAAVGAAVAANRTLSGTCDFLETQAANTADLETQGAVAARWGDAALVAAYNTQNPL
jgi:hypothetical protein